MSASLFLRPVPADMFLAIQLYFFPVHCAPFLKFQKSILSGKNAYETDFSASYVKLTFCLSVSGKLKTDRKDIVLRT